MLTAGEGQPSTVAFLHKTPLPFLTYAVCLVTIHIAEYAVMGLFLAQNMMCKVFFNNLLTCSNAINVVSLIISSLYFLVGVQGYIYINVVSLIIKFVFSCWCVGNLLSESEGDTSSVGTNSDSELSAGELSEEEEECDDNETQKYNQGDLQKDEATAEIFLASLQEDIEKGKAAKDQIGKCV